ncbi:MAG: hypothetical protein E6G20_00630 [Actinobacteria bacterium]|nr:MAG: hypothetical protein E6G20_00630 [Actinomycetota bacterium]
MPELPLRGGCMCGGVRFEVTEAPAHAGYCHCRRCQRRTGTAASISARIAPGSLRILEGEELIKAYEPEVEQASDGPGRDQRAARGLRRRPGRASVVPPVRRLRRALGAASGRRARALPGAPAVVVVAVSRGRSDSAARAPHDRGRSHARGRARLLPAAARHGEPD